MAVISYHVDGLFLDTWVISKHFAIIRDNWKS